MKTPKENPFEGLAPPSTTAQSIMLPKKYDVFICHHGGDVKQKLAIPLHAILHCVGLNVFLDSQELQVGDRFPCAIREAIGSARIYVIIFSKNFAKSAWCLAELCYIMKLVGSNVDSYIIPVNYDVQPWDVRCPDKGEYTEAFSEFEGKEKHLQMLPPRKSALHQASFHYGLQFRG
ncbi:hypothetical protein SUGI_0105440 [Cryptomeria japonica]|uniref:disease resistance protein Roq1-like n=1 Tax=Cryptomeria japonica TaxID=3369 RepID=UPI002408C2F1|nr:disease resistance protein Roq1-like [Cryptomeria japonica]GLJ09276.1 hypothetical protein SUGI_0105440 [Cryptomeria japonica]